MTPHTRSPHSELPEVEANLPKHHAPLPEIWDKDRDGHHDPEGIDFIAVQNSAEYRALRTSHVRFAFPMVITFVGYYFVFVLLSTYAPAFMGARIAGSYIPWGVPLGLLAFASTWFVTWAYVRHANKNLDPRSTALREALEKKAAL
ncbi:DUF485 domain-containing protein [Raineyella fluvialis]|uniref:DUF485 domain-containing protein n=1 Tax=Raineyella fluvialis TaxID=2662261 RepID=A0A5Q2FBU2_9ACTN|nr:DUF485 domain-containing protein [Raineyella fluvialis]QGF22513.1 DUF485 domain-containing protein [Raineyella fluvialis]